MRVIGESVDFACGSGLSTTDRTERELKSQKAYSPGVDSLVLLPDFHPAIVM